MCIIIDACMRDKCFGDNMHPDAKPIFAWLLTGNGRIVYGGKLLMELEKRPKAKNHLAKLLRAGRARYITDARLEKISKQLESSKSCISNDSHVLALAIVSGARILYSNDERLRRDFKNTAIISHPRGTLYTKASHHKVLKHSVSCGIKPSKSMRRRRNR